MIQFKEAGFAGELEQLKSKNYALYTLMQDLASFVYDEFSKDVVITMIFRTKEQQESIYGAGTKRKSPHMFWNAVDIRDRIYTAAEKAQIIKWLKDGYDSTNQLNYINAASSKTVWLHQVGTHGMHFHLQYRGPVVYNFSEGMTISG